ncbi:MAG: 4Fe-4S binding protein [Bacteroidales bacterium]
MQCRANEIRDFKEDQDRWGFPVIVSITLIFIDFRHLIPESWINVVTYLQFTPSFLKFITLPSVAAAGFIIVLALTVFTGRSYCSFFCPLGIFQDIISRIGGRVKRRNRNSGMRCPIPYCDTLFWVR